MAKRRQNGRSRTARRCFSLFGLGLTLVTGCSQTQTATTQPADPLHGVLTPPGMPQPTGVPKTPGTPTSLPGNSQGQQPGRWDLSSTNNATLAGLSGGPLGRPLAIDDQGRVLPTSQLTNGAPAAQTPGFPAYNPNPRVERIPDANPAPSLTPSSWQTPQPAPTPTPTPVNTEALTRQLQERGVINQKIDQLSSGIHLTCYVSRGQAGGLRLLEVTAVDYASAAQAILRQLDGGAK